MPSDQPLSLESLLKDEYFYLQKTVEDFDSKGITIKAWSVSGSLVLIGAGLSDKGSKELFLVAAVASLLFWFVEANWKGFQLSYYKRIGEIEGYFADPANSHIKPLQISSSWGESWHEHHQKQVGSILWWPTVMFPHVFLSVGGSILYLLVTLQLIIIK